MRAFLTFKNPCARSDSDRASNRIARVPCNRPHGPNADIYKLQESFPADNFNVQQGASSRQLVGVSATPITCDLAALLFGKALSRVALPLPRWTTDHMSRISILPLVLATLLGIAAQSQAQTILYQENFGTACNSSPAAVPAPLITHNGDGLTAAASVSFVNNAWVVRDDFGREIGNCAAFSTSWYAPPGTADDWLVLPQVTAAAGTRLSWRAVAYDTAFRDGYEVRLSTGGSNPGDFTTVLLTVGQEAAAWTPHELSLAAYAGQTVRIAFRNNSNDKFLLLLDDLLIQDVPAGACGAAQGGLFSSAPAADLCSAGTASAVTANLSTYNWTCGGAGVVSPANCSADKGYDVAVTASPPGGGSAACTSNPVVHGGNTTCTPTASTGYSFTNWSGDCSGSTCVLGNVTSSHSVQANFALNTYGIGTQVLPAGAGTVSCTNNPVTHGDSTTCTYSANPGYTFTHWSGDCLGATCNIPAVTSSKSVIANFVSQSQTLSTPGGNVVLGVGGTWGITSTNQTPAAAPAPSESSYPYGQMGFRAVGPAGGSLTVTLTFPSPIPVGSKLLKYTGSTWVEWPTTPVGDNALSFTVSDAQNAGSTGASTGDLNATPGIIDDPVALAVPLAAGAAAIPTLSQWALIVLSSLVGIFGFAWTRRRGT